VNGKGFLTVSILAMSSEAGPAAALAPGSACIPTEVMAAGKPDAGTSDIGVVLCCDQRMLERAQRLRYDVYCTELGRPSPHADHGRRLISDDLDEFGHTFVAIQTGETIGTLRTNFAKEGDLGILEEVYGMRQSKHHPGHTAICTKFIVARARRGSLAFVRLVVAWLDYVTRKGVRECYIDCIPGLVPFYERFEFKPAAASFLHCENGLSVPLMLDLTRHGHALCDRFGVRAPRKFDA
jgi:hypothetical protein